MTKLLNNGSFKSLRCFRELLKDLITPDLHCIITSCQEKKVIRTPCPLLSKKQGNISYKKKDLKTQSRRNIRGLYRGCGNRP